MKPLGKSPVKKPLRSYPPPLPFPPDSSISYRVYIRRPRKEKIKEGKKGGAMKGFTLGPSGTELSLPPSKCRMEARVKRTARCPSVRVNCHTALTWNACYATIVCVDGPTCVIVRYEQPSWRVLEHYQQWWLQTWFVMLLLLKYCDLSTTSSSSARIYKITKLQELIQKFELKEILQRVTKVF